jgi:hypothetical protein
MFYLIVKDPRRIPPERAALDQGIRSLAACPRTCCAAFSWSLGGSSVLSAFTESIEISGGCQWIFSICSARFAAPNLKDRSQKPGACAHGVLVGNFAQERNFLSPCNGLFALEGVSFATGFLLDPARRKSSQTF